MKGFGFTVLVCLALLAGVSFGRAEGIAAVVNSDIITTTDLHDRAEMLLKSSGQPASAAMINRVQGQVLEGLIAETVQLQEAKRQGVTVTDDEVQDGLGKIAASNKFSVSQFKDILRRQGIRMSSIERQIRAQIGWGKVIQKVLRPRVVVGESEISAERARMAASAGKREFYAAEIFLPVSKSGDDAKVRELAQTLVQQIRAGKPFPMIARENSQSASAAAGGMIGWVREGQLESALDKALGSLPPNQVSQPVRGEDGYYLLYVRDVRAQGAAASPDDAVLTLKELTIDDTGLRDQQAHAEAIGIARDLTGCMDIVRKAASDKRFKLSERKVAINELTDTERKRLGNFDIGKAVDPQFGANFAVISMVCSRDDPKGPMADDAALERKIGLERLDLLQKRYLRDLISAAYIERRD
ncbi:MAG: SurA N-terminal domain-containing protein [Rhodospirillales bacterium]|nr:SurA N-terminal domain-containing protein [Alphaproteobacteria bacterium]MCB9986706.1 SurA N-terminal domain-containing protein [Rhodospirillales bacterium]USO08523.1 MAG: SurA N-terminal domain-containing protein [Rhodospirillales bacterium]